MPVPSTVGLLMKQIVPIVVSDVNALWRQLCGCMCSPGGWIWVL